MRWKEYEESGFGMRVGKMRSFRDGKSLQREMSKKQLAMEKRGVHRTYLS